MSIPGNNSHESWLFNGSIIDIQFPSEIKAQKKSSTIKEFDFLVFIIDDNPETLESLNTALNKMEIKNSANQSIKLHVKNFTTATSAITHLTEQPDLIILNVLVNARIRNAMRGPEIIETIKKNNPNQRLIILNELNLDLHQAYIKKGLYDYTINDEFTENSLKQVIINSLPITA